MITQGSSLYKAGEILSIFPEVTSESEDAEEVNEVHPLKMRENEMCLKGVLEVLDEQGIDDPGLESKVLDFTAGGGQMGDMLAGQGFTEIYGQEGSQSKLLFLL